jgi:hypothetical protein
MQTGRFLLLRVDWDGHVWPAATDTVLTQALITSSALQ